MRLPEKDKRYKFDIRHRMLHGLLQIVDGLVSVLTFGQIRSKYGTRYTNKVLKSWLSRCWNKSHPDKYKGKNV